MFIILLFLWKYQNNVYQNVLFSELLRTEGGGKLLQNFQRNILKVKSPHDLRQQLYSVILSRPHKYGSITLTKVSTPTDEKEIQDQVEIKVPKSPLIECVRETEINNIKSIESELYKVTDSDWESFNIMTRGGAVIQEIQSFFYDDVYYSPLIPEMIEEGKLVKLR